MAKSLGLARALLLVLLAGCATAPVRQPLVPPSELGEGWYQQAEASGRKVLRIDQQRSLIAITVRRAGSLARLGHDHVVASHGITGYVAADEGRADFHFRLDQLSVDEPELRLAARLDTQPSLEAIDGTRRNMLTKVLEAERFPLVLLHVERANAADATVRLSITLHGTVRTIDVPVQIAPSEGGIDASGTFGLLQSDFGITPMSVLGGAIAVQDRIELRFHIIAHKP